MRVLVTGAGGQLGRDVVSAFDDHDVVGLSRDQLDVGDRDAVFAAVLGLRPQAIVHAAAWTAVDACEGDPDRAFRVNALATRHVAGAAALVDASVLYLSTDYVFDGTSAIPYTEWDTPNPRSVYGRSKHGGETELGPRSTIVRTSWLFGANGNNMVKTALRLAAGEQPLRFVADQHGCPTNTCDLASMIRRLVTSRLAGVFHVTNQGATTWWEFVRAVLEAAGHDPERVEPVTTADVPRPAPRPAYSVLDNAALRLQGIPLLPDWHEPLEGLVKELRA